jgi:hypothetical protein
MRGKRRREWNMLNPPRIYIFEIESKVMKVVPLAEYSTYRKPQFESN